MYFYLFIFLGLTSGAWAGADAPLTKDFPTWQDNRMQLQSKFSKLEAKLSTVADLKTADAIQREALDFFKALGKFKIDFLIYEEPRYNYWNSESYWSTKNWMKGVCIKQTVDKLRLALNNITSTTLSSSPPFSKSDLNSAQKMLDAIRTALELDKDLQQQSKYIVK